VYLATLTQVGFYNYRWIYFHLEGVNKDDLVRWEITPSEVVALGWIFTPGMQGGKFPPFYEK
jgi:hypothetical protein